MVSLDGFVVHVYSLSVYRFWKGQLDARKNRQEEAGARGCLYYKDTNGLVPPVSASVSPGV